MPRPNRVKIFLLCFQTPYNLCSVRGGVQFCAEYHEYRGNILSTVGDVQYHGDIMINVGRYLVCYRGVQQVDIMSTMGGYFEYCGGCSVQWRIS